MNTLWFVKFDSLRDCNQVVFLTTADSQDLAEHNGWQRITPEYRDLYKLAEVTAVCQTPDTVEGFEPC